MESVNAIRIFCVCLSLMQQVPRQSTCLRCAVVECHVTLISLFLLYLLWIIWIWIASINSWTMPYINPCSFDVRNSRILDCPKNARRTNSFYLRNLIFSHDNFLPTRHLRADLHWHSHELTQSSNSCSTTTKFNAERIFEHHCKEWNCIYRGTNMQRKQKPKNKKPSMPLESIIEISSAKQMQSKSEQKH